MRPLGPKTVEQYRRVMERAFGDRGPHGAPAKIKDWGDGSKRLLRAALLRHYGELDQDPPPGLLKLCEVPWRPSRLAKSPDEDEMEAYEKACSHLPGEIRALALLPLATGLRADELIGLSRESVKSAVKSGTLVVLRKGGREKEITTTHVKELLQGLLAKRNWETVGDLLSTEAGPNGRYRALWRLVKNVGEAVGLQGLRPHLLRHAYATRLNRDGAPLATIQKALGHSSIRTTSLYVHASVEDVEKFSRKF